ncbi:MAG: hypothetical protein F6J87_03995 [Spirulina sp. SIO3F2]|nr:hypothetical protein [Spirulina sp. SIO3F2]
MILKLKRWFRALSHKTPKYSFHELLSVLAHGDDSQLKTVIYNYQLLTESEWQIPLKLLRKLQSPESKQNLSVVEEHYLDRFVLLILRVPWLDEPDVPLSKLHPLIVAEQDGKLRAIGYVLPWNEITEQFSTVDVSTIRQLSMIWIQKTIAAQ